MTMSWFQLGWLHDISQSALAAAVVALGLVILLELRSIKSLRRSVDNNLGRVFEQLDLMRFEQQPAQTANAPGTNTHGAPAGSAPAAATAAPAASNAYVAAAALASSGMQAEEIAQRCGLAAGEARLLASLAAARSSRRVDA
jgi:hypothetical protein